MEKVWYTINLGTNPADEHYVIGDFNYALFTSIKETDFEIVN